MSKLLTSLSMSTVYRQNLMKIYLNYFTDIYIVLVFKCILFRFGKEFTLFFNRSCDLRLFLPHDLQTF